MKKAILLTVAALVVASLTGCHTCRNMMGGWFNRGDQCGEAPPAVRCPPGVPRATMMYPQLAPDSAGADRDRAGAIGASASPSPRGRGRREGSPICRCARPHPNLLLKGEGKRLLSGRSLRKCAAGTLHREKCGRPRRLLTVDALNCLMAALSRAGCADRAHFCRPNSRLLRTRIML